MSREMASCEICNTLAVLQSTRESYNIVLIDGWQAGRCCLYRPSSKTVSQESFYHPGPVRRVVLALLPQRLQEVLAVHHLLRVHHSELDQLLHDPDGPVLAVLLDLLPALCLRRGLGSSDLLDDVLQLRGELGDQDEVLLHHVVSQARVYTVWRGPVAVNKQ